MADKLVLCAGKQHHNEKGWITLDSDPVCRPGILASIPPLPDIVMDHSWQAIELIHGIEHFYKWEATELLKAIHQVLKPGGTLILEQPNIEYAAKVLLGQIDPPKQYPEQFSMWPLYGDPGHKKVGFVHRWGYTPRTLRDALVAAGFAKQAIELKKAQHHFPVRDFRLVATK